MSLQVVILCGGYGTRMGSATGRLPKPMLAVGDKPLLWHILRTYADQGHTRFVLCLGYLGDVIRAWFAANPQPGWDIQLVDTGQGTLTGGRLLAVQSHLAPDAPWLMTYGDGVADVDLAALIQHHRSEGRLATVTAMRPRSRFGILDLDGGQVTRFREKPLLDQRVSGGFFVFEPGAAAHMRPDQALEQGALQALAQADQLSAWTHDGFWMSVDTPRDLAGLNRLHDQGVRPWLACS